MTPQNINLDLKPRFYLLGKNDNKNPKSIPLDTLQKWHNSGAISYLGESNDVREFIKLASAVVLPSFYKEGVPRVLLEALAMGKPIITTDMSGCRDLITISGDLEGDLDSKDSPDSHDSTHLKITQDSKDSQDSSVIIGENGFLIAPNSIKALYNSIVRFMQTNTAKMAESALNEAKKYDQNIIINIYHKKISAQLKSPQITESTKATQATQPTQKNLKNPNFANLDSVRSKDSTDSTQDSINADSPDSTHDSKPKILFISNSCFGMWNFRLKALQNIAKSGYEIHIIAPFDASAENLKNEGFMLYDIFIDPKSLNPLKDLRFFRSLRAMIRQIRPNLIFSYTIKPVIYGSFIANRLKIPNIAVTTGLGYVFIPSGIFKKILKNIVVWLYKHALKGTNEVWFLNKDDREEFIKSKIIEPSKSFILPSEGVDLEHFRADFKPKSDFKPQNQAQEEYLNNPPKDGEIRFLLIARMLWDKGVGEFVEVAKMFERESANSEKSRIGGGQRYYRIRFYLLGKSDAKNPQAIPAETLQKWHNSGAVSYLGETSDVREFIKLASAVVLPSYREGVAISLLESMAMETPIITTNAIGCKELVRNYPNQSEINGNLNKINGFLCEVGDTNSLKTALDSFIAHQNKPILGENAREFAKKFDINNTIKIYQNTIDVLIAGGGYELRFRLCILSLQSSNNVKWRLE
ncbi:hypothetical protein CCY99_07455 [Helicobacter sp. 16-1353]|uniref:glycosyltransferase n=1 Tax=Helicobacter sp. 16-1353 TaxID=2004996 RepID=UPI000DCE293C|nr:glycosyltransferase [Helicobacter sp. 16-1353]RAX52474.1 hypothetical protein CCY99_07455 [Helicobacter sp. 16-1353]